MDLAGRLHDLPHELDRTAVYPIPYSAAGTNAEPPPESAADAASGHHSLKSIMNMIRSPEFTGELTTRIMEYTTEILGRSVLFSVQSGQFCGMGYYSSKPVDQSTLEAVRELRIPVGEPSLLADVAARHQSYKGGLPDVSLNRRIIDCL